MEGKLSAGHGRALVGVEDPEYLADLILEKNLNVRQAELLSKEDLTKERGVASASHPDPEKEILRNHLSELLDQPIDLILKGMGGKIVIPFKNPTDLDEILKKLNSISTPSKSSPFSASVV